MSKYNYTVPVQREIDAHNPDSLQTLYRLVDWKRADEQEMFLIDSLTRCFVGRVNGMQFQLRITPTNRKSLRSAERMPTNAEMIVFDASGSIDDHFIKGWHWQYPVDHIKKEMRQNAVTRHREGWKEKP
jgi:hypothetical protein